MVPEYRHKDGTTERTVPGSARDRQLAARPQPDPEPEGPVEGHDSEE